MNPEKKNLQTQRISNQEFERYKKQRKIPKECGLKTVSDDSLFAKTPQSMSRDPEIPLQAKALFGICHTFCPEKDLTKECVTTVALATLAKYSSKHPATVSRYLRILHNAGWITIIRRGVNRTNLIYLHEKRKRR